MSRRHGYFAVLRGNVRQTQWFEIRRQFRKIRVLTMGGLGSGRLNTSGRTKIDGFRSLDVNFLNKAGCLVPSWRGNWQWLRDGECVAWIQLGVNSNQLFLSYRYRLNGGEWHDVEESIRIVRVPCHFGGERPYFICPGNVPESPCDRRVAKLYGAGKYFLCRHCHRLDYASQSEGEFDRLLRKANKIRTSLGGEPGMSAPFPKRPKGMWQETYERLHQTVMNAEMKVEDVFFVRAGQLISRNNASNRKKKFWP